MSSARAAAKETSQTSERVRGYIISAFRFNLSSVETEKFSSSQVSRGSRSLPKPALAPSTTPSFQAFALNMLWDKRC